MGRTLIDKILPKLKFIFFKPQFFIFMRNQKSLYERNAAVSAGPWGEPTGGAADNFELNYYLEGGNVVVGKHHGKEVEAIDLFHGVLCRIVNPDDSRLMEAQEAAQNIVPGGHVGKGMLAETIIGLKERLKKSYAELGVGPGRVILASSGEYANAVAARLATGFTGHRQEVFLNGCYHGNGFHGNAVVDLPGWQGEFSPRLSIPPRYVKHGDLEGLNRALNNGEAGAFFAESITGLDGFRNPGKDFLTDAYDMVGEHGAVYVDDEVQTGMRRGSYWAVPAWLRSSKKRTPLIVTTGKAFGNGCPIAAVMVPQIIIDDLTSNPQKYGKHWDTFDSNILSATTAAAVFDIFHEEILGGRTTLVRHEFLKQIESVVSERPDMEVRGDGLMIGIGMENPAMIAQAVNTAPAFGVIVGGAATGIRIAPLADIPFDVANEAGQRVAKLLDSLPRAV